jgi:D-3-phosphoglycerate dehydrogenase / 2-oxoglutarate reductase
LRPFKVVLVETGEPATTVPQWVSEELAAENVTFVAWPCHTVEQLEQHASDADMVWLWGSPIVTAEALDVIPRCGAILRSGSGTDNVPVAAATQRRILVINTPSAVAQEVSVHAIALLLAIVRQIVPQDRAMRSGIWDHRREKNRWHLRGCTIGLIGFGHIAQLVARKITAFGVHVLVYDPWVPDSRVRAFGAERVELPALLARSDFISVHCPLTQDTRHLLGENEIRLMNPHAIVINTSRGPVIDEAALICALREGRIGGAGLDVFESEPLAADSPLLRMENVVTTPHIAGYSDKFPECFWRYATESIIAVANGYWPRSVVNPEVEAHWSLQRREWPLELPI